MSLRVIGAGVGRTGTFSLHLGLNRLLPRPCYHMFEVLQRPDHLPVWERAFAGELPEWEELFHGYGGAVGGPASAFWRELSQAYPDAVVVLSVRDPDEWWASHSRTVLEVLERAAAPGAEQGTDNARTIELGRLAMVRHLTDRWTDRRAMTAAYQRHNDEVRETVPRDRLVEWHPRSGWGPLCEALGTPVPGAPFPHRNTTAELRRKAGLP